MSQQSCDVLVIGAGIVGIATAYYLKLMKPALSVVLVDSAAPMTRTSAVSGENYRNWWPHPVMTSFTDHSIDLLETLSLESDNRVGMTRRGYALATRSSNIDKLLNELSVGYGGSDQIRVHDGVNSASYRPAVCADWKAAPDGVDVLTNTELIRRTFPSFDPAVRTVVHIRRAGAIDGQQTGQHMLECYRLMGGRQLTGTVASIDKSDDFRIRLTGPDTHLQATQLVNAAGPWIADIARMIGSVLPVKNVVQQKIAFEDVGRAIPRDMPFAIDLDPQHLDWTSEERDLLSHDPALARFAEQMPGATHCRPEGGDTGTWLKLGWAYNEAQTCAVDDPVLSDTFTEIVLRGAARLNPSLSVYDSHLPRGARHYGGYYTMTDENWPIIGKMSVEGSYVVGAMSGFGTMAACAGGELCARHVIGTDLPSEAVMLSLARHKDCELMSSLNCASSRGIL